MNADKRGLETEGRRQKAVGGGQWSVGSRQEAEVRDQKSEVRSQKSEIRSQIRLRFRVRWCDFVDRSLLLVKTRSTK